jgi:multidrug resistance efflux pump
MPWLLGTVLLAITLFVASKYLTSGPTDGSRDPKTNGKGPAIPPSAQVVCHGTVDVEGMVRNLTPTQMGEVAEIFVKEGQSVKQNDPILRVNEEPAQIGVAQAEAGLKNAEALLAQAQLGIELLRLGLEKQQSAIDAAQSKLAAAESQLKRLEGLRRSELSNDNDINAAGEAVKALKAALAAEQTEYRRIQAMKPEEKVREAQAGVDVAKERVRAEKYKLDQCTLRAPCDGTILRINSAVGTLISPQLRSPPVIMAPDGPRIVRAEILPEFAHRVQPGMDAIIHDDANAGFTWNGKVLRLADGYFPKRSQGEGISLTGNETLLLECIIQLAPTNQPPRINQRVRVAIGAKQ